MVCALHDFAADVLARMQADNLMSIEDPRSLEQKLSAHELNMFAYSLKRAATKFESGEYVFIIKIKDPSSFTNNQNGIALDQSPIDIWEY